MSSMNIRVRMYCQGLGDCFLLTFPRSGVGRSEYHILIDCGVIGGTENATEIMTAVVDNIHEVTGGHLDLVVATHEHWDHLSGFNQVRERFEHDFEIDAVWLGWTEDPKDPKDLIKNRAAKLKALKTAVKKIADTGMHIPGMAEQHKSIQQVLSFFGDEDQQSGLGVNSPAQAASLVKARTTRDALDFLSQHPKAAVTYCYPSKPPMLLDGVDGVRVYVFGPPEDTSYLKISAPTKNAKTYGLTAQSGEDSFIAALNSGEDDPLYSDMKDLTYPFEKTERIEFTKVGHSNCASFFDEHYNLLPGAKDAWRRIDTDWLDVTSELALNLDSNTNNTSLVLAFEIGEPGIGKVLLFAADAQVGNWLSWKDLEWSLNVQDQSIRKVSAHDLLKRTVLYKVGHHGSHNATLSELGLDLMNSPDLVALLPVDGKKAHDKGWDEMPFGPLLTTLEEKTRGRMIRIDDPDLPLRSPGSHLSDAQWKDFLTSLTPASVDIPDVGHKKLYLEMNIKIDN